MCFVSFVNGKRSNVRSYSQQWSSVSFCQLKWGVGQLYIAVDWNRSVFDKGASVRLSNDTRLVARSLRHSRVLFPSRLLCTGSIWRQTENDVCRRRRTVKGAQHCVVSARVETESLRFYKRCRDPRQNSRRMCCEQHKNSRTLGLISPVMLNCFGLFAL